MVPMWMFPVALAYGNTFVLKPSEGDPSQPRFRPCDHDYEYGNGAAIFTRDGGAAREFSNCIRIGMVGVNVPILVPMAFPSFGGWKRSLFGDMAVHGPEGVRFYTPLKTMTARRHPRLREIRDADDEVRSAPDRVKMPYASQAVLACSSPNGTMKPRLLIGRCQKS